MSNPTRRTCFVVGPIGAANTKVRGHADWLLNEIIQPVFAENFKDFDVIRADKISELGMIDSQVINHLLNDDLVIADMTLLNANAFYEMGIRHMERKPIIHMYLEGQDIPFDVKPFRAISFSFEHPDLRFEARKLLRQAVEAVLAPGFQVENPVTRARGIAEISRHAMPGFDVLLAEIASLRNRMRALEASDASGMSLAQLASRYGSLSPRPVGLLSLVEPFADVSKEPALKFTLSDLAKETPPKPSGLGGLLSELGRTEAPPKKKK